jgi:hypothetical protein
VETERLTPLSRYDSVGDERITRRPSHPLAESVDRPGDEDGGPRGVAKAMSNLPNAARP